MTGSEPDAAIAAAVGETCSVAVGDVAEAEGHVAEAAMAAGGATEGDVDPAAMRRVMRAMRPAERLILTVTDSMVELRTGRGAPLLLRLDGEEIEIDLGDDRSMKARAAWKGETLELRADLGGGFTINRSYSLDSETGHLQIDVSSRVRGRRMQTIQVYDRTSR